MICFLLKNNNFWSIHIKHIIFFWLWKKSFFLRFFLKNAGIYNVILLKKLKFFQIQNSAYISCATCVQINLMTLIAFFIDIVSKNWILSRYTSGTPIFLNFEKKCFLEIFPQKRLDLQRDGSFFFMTCKWAKNLDHPPPISSHEVLWIIPSVQKFYFINEKIANKNLSDWLN